MLRGLLVAAFASLTLASVAYAQFGDVKPLVPQNELERHLIAYATDNDKWPSFINAVMEGQLCLAGKAFGDGEVRYGVITSSDGVQEMLLYTSADRVIEVHGQEGRSRCDKGKVILNELRGRNVVLNLGFNYGVTWTPQDLEVILGGERTIRNDTQIQLSAPDSRADDLAKAIRETLTPIAEVQQATLYHAKWTESGETVWYLEVRTTSSERVVMEALRAGMRGVKADGMPTDIVINRPGKPAAGGRVLLAR